MSVRVRHESRVASNPAAEALLTIEEVSRLLLRRWYIVALGVLCTLLVAGSVLARDGIYTTQVDVVFLAPSEPPTGNALTISQESLIYFAAIVERDVNSGRTGPRMSSATASLYGQGVREGYSVSLPNTGGQWANNFSRPVLDVEVVGASPEQVRLNLEAVLTRIEDTVAERQLSAGARRATWVSTQVAPATPVIGYVPVQGKRAALALGLLGGIVTLVATIQTDEWQSRRRRRGASTH